METDLEALWQAILDVEPVRVKRAQAAPVTRKAASHSTSGLLPGIDGYVDPALEGKRYIPRIEPGWEKVDPESPPAQLVGEYIETRQTEGETWYMLRLVAQGKGTAAQLGGIYSMRAARLITVEEAMRCLTQGSFAHK